MHFVPLPRRRAAWAFAGLMLLAAHAPRASAQAPALTDPRFLPGDRAIATPVGTQDFARVAAGGGGYLVVWEDERPVLSGFTGTDQPLGGNGIDIYAARLDAAGHLMGEGAIVVSQLGRDQTKPEVAWNEDAQAWLVVWTTQRPDWYFYQDLVGARVAADGTLLDITPIPLRRESDSPANDYGRNPTVASDGHTWIVAWEDQAWSGGIGRTNISARRVAPDGTVIDATAAVLYQHPDDVFGPIAPHLAWATDEYLLVWERAGYYDLYGRRISAALAPLGAQFLITSTGYGPRVATNGADFMVLSRYNHVHRVTHAGVSLDPAGIDLAVYPASEFRGGDIAWNGTHYVIASSSPRPFPAGSAVFLTRVTTSGTLVSPGIAILPPVAGDQMLPSIGSAGGALTQLVWTERNLGAQQLEDIRGTQVNGATPSTNVAISTGWPRQERVRFATNGSEHMAVYLSEQSGLSRVLAQRVSSTGTPLDAEPVELGTAPETFKIFPDVAWNGSVYLVSWCYNGIVYARRLAAGGTPVDPAPVALANDTANTVGVGALGANFLVAYTHTFSGDQRSVKGIVVRGPDLGIVGAAVTIGGSWVDPYPQVRALGSRWLVAWVHRPTHDSPASSVMAAFVDAAGVPAPVFTASGAGYGFEADVAATGDRAFLAYVDDASFTDAQIQGRVLNADGTFRGGEFTICQAPKHQRFASCAWDGGQFVAAWTDFRNLGTVDQLRGDIYAARISADGAVQDPDGFQVTSGSLPEDLPAVAGTGGIALIGNSELDGVRGGEVQRIGYRLFGSGGVTGVEPSAPPGEFAARVGPNPFTSHVTIDLQATAGEGSALSSGFEAGTPLRLEIYSPDGRRVWMREFAPGARHFEWDGSDRGGRTAPAGVYFARLSAGTRVLVKRSVIRIN